VVGGAGWRGGKMALYFPADGKKISRKGRERAFLLAGLFGWLSEKKEKINGGKFLDP